LAELGRPACAKCSRGSVAFRRVEREPADEFGLEGVGQLAGAADFFFEVAVERDKLGSRVPSSTSRSFTLPIGEPIDATFMPYSSSIWAKLGDLVLGELHHILDASPTSTKRRL